MTNVTLDRRTRDPLRVGSRQTLVLGFTCTGCSSLTLEVPLGSGAEALMTEEEFSQTQYDFNPYMDVNEPVTDKALGRFRINFDDPKSIYAAEFTLKDFLVASAGKVRIRAVTSDKAEDGADVFKEARSPEIRSFEADRYNVKLGAKVKFSWSIDPAPRGDDSLFLNERKLDLTPPELTEKIANASDYTLSLKGANGKVVSQRQLRIHTFGTSEFDSRELNMETPEGTKPAGVLGCFAGNGFLWVLLREDDKTATLWKTRHGFDPSDAQWQQERQDGAPVSRPVRIPLHAARRPGVIFKDQLWLLGGDCCHPDRTSSAIGRYHLQGNGEFREEISRKEDRKWPARMGHAVLRVDDDRMWVLGGWRQGGGPLNDIWQFKDKAWKELPRPAWEPRCLFGAAVTETDVWIAGGFESPGGITYDDIWRRSKSESNPTWYNINKTLSPYKDGQYRASTMFVLDKTLFILSTHYDLPEEHYIQPVTYDNNDWKKGGPYPISKLTDIMKFLDYFRLDGAPFNGAMFLRSLSPGALDLNKALYFYVKG